VPSLPPRVRLQRERDLPREAGLAALRRPADPHDAAVLQRPRGRLHAGDVAHERRLHDRPRRRALRQLLPHRTRHRRERVERIRRARGAVLGRPRDEILDPASPRRRRRGGQGRDVDPLRDRASEPRVHARTERVEIRALGAGAHRRFGREEAPRPSREPVRTERRPREPEIDQHRERSVVGERRARGPHEHVRGAHVAMHEARRVKRRERREQLRRHVEHQPKPLVRSALERRERDVASLAFHELLHQHRGPARQPKGLPEGRRHPQELDHTRQRGVRHSPQHGELELQ